MIFAVSWFPQSFCPIHTLFSVRLVWLRMIKRAGAVVVGSGVCRLCEHALTMEFRYYVKHRPSGMTYFTNSITVYLSVTENFRP
ncbi:hypothetical protein LX94_05133 [Mameliella alba]|nr:hypothetical protein LX94_05133 [Mameliella alba]